MEGLGHYEELFRHAHGDSDEDYKFFSVSRIRQLERGLGRVGGQQVRGRVGDREDTRMANNNLE